MKMTMNKTTCVAKLVNRFLAKVIIFLTLGIVMYECHSSKSCTSYRFISGASASPPSYHVQQIARSLGLFFEPMGTADNNMHKIIIADNRMFLQNKINVPLVIVNFIASLLLCAQIVSQNKWLFVLPKPESITLNCPDSSPFDTRLSGTGFLTIDAPCKAYSATAILIPEDTKTSNVTLKFPLYSLSHDCCEELELKADAEFSFVQHLKTVPSSIPLLNMDELNVASHKLDQIREKAEEMLTEKRYVRSMSITEILVYTVIAIVLGYVLVVLLLKCKRLLNNNPQCKDNYPSVTCNILNLCASKSKVDNASDDISLNELSELSGTSSTDPRRSERIKKIVQLKMSQE